MPLGHRYRNARGFAENEGIMRQMTYARIVAYCIGAILAFNSVGCFVQAYLRASIADADVLPGWAQWLASINLKGDSFYGSKWRWLNSIVTAFVFGIVAVLVIRDAILWRPVFPH